MKKLLVILTMLTLAVSLFAQEEEQAAPSGKQKKEFDLEITGGVPIHWTNTEHGVTEEKNVVGSVSLGLALVFNFNQKVGLTIDSDFSFAQSLYGDPTPLSSYYSQVTANILIGPVVYLYNGSFLRIPLAFGVHGFYYNNDHWDTTPAVYYNVNDYQFGPGLYIGIQFHFNNNIYILTRTNVNYDIARYYTSKVGTGGGTPSVTSGSEFKLIGAWSVKPVIGLGIKF
jgi:hypothetical protein